MEGKVRTVYGDTKERSCPERYKHGGARWPVSSDLIRGWLSSDWQVKAMVPEVTYRVKATER